MRTYQRTWLRADVVAGLVLTALLISQGMAYAELAGLPAVTGLYTTESSRLFAYALFGPSRILVVGAGFSARSADRGRAPAARGHTFGSLPRQIALASMLALLMGALCIAAGFPRLGVLAELLSKPVRLGFLNGIAVIVLVGQLPKLFGFTSTAQGLLDEIDAFVSGLRDGNTVPASFVIGVASLAVILGFRRFTRRCPGYCWPSSALPSRWVPWTSPRMVWRSSAPYRPASRGRASPGGSPRSHATVRGRRGIALVVLADTTALSRPSARHGDRVDANQEIRALGAANRAAGIFPGFPVSLVRLTHDRGRGLGHVHASDRRRRHAGRRRDPSRSERSRPVHPFVDPSAIIIAAAFTLFDFRSLRWLWKVRRSELWLSLVALLGVAVLGALEGISSRSRSRSATSSGAPGGPTTRSSVASTARRAITTSTVILKRARSPACCCPVRRSALLCQRRALRDRLLRAVARRGEPTRWVIMAAEPITDIDTTGAEILGELLAALNAERVTLAFAELKGPVKDRLRSYDLYDRIGDSQFFPTLGTTINGYLRRRELNGSTGARPDRTTPNHDGSRVTPRPLRNPQRPPLPLMPGDRPIPDTATL